jgi:hypothetical protein
MLMEVAPHRDDGRLDLSGEGSDAGGQSRGDALRLR